MMYSYRIEQAIRAASVLHRNMESGRRLAFPYVAHVFSVSCIIADYTTDEDTIIAGLLHDAVAQTDYTFAELEKDFGRAVCSLVKQITMPFSPEDTHEDWKERHIRYAAQLKDASDEALIVLAADKIHHMRSIIEEYYRDHARFERDFGDTHDQDMITYQNIGNLLNSRRKNDIVHEFNHVFDEYKNFIYGAEAAHTA